jgi:hypothetical protein
LDVVVPGFDRFLHQSIPDFRLPGTLLLPISVRMPVLAGIAQVVSWPTAGQKVCLALLPRPHGPDWQSASGG